MPVHYRLPKVSFKPSLMDMLIKRRLTMHK